MRQQQKHESDAFFTCIIVKLKRFNRQLSEFSTMNIQRQGTQYDAKNTFQKKFT